MPNGSLACLFNYLTVVLVVSVNFFTQVNALEDKFFKYTNIWLLCKQKWVESTFCGWSHFLTLNLTVERFIAVYFPTKYNSIVNKKRCDYKQ